MKPEEEAATAANNASNRVPQAAVIPPNLTTLSNNATDEEELKQQKNSTFENNAKSQQKKQPPAAAAAAAATTTVAPTAAPAFQFPTTQQPGPLFFPPFQQPSATSAAGVMAHTSSSVGSSLPFHAHGAAAAVGAAAAGGVGANVGMLTSLGTMMNHHPFVPLPQALAASAEQQQRLQSCGVTTPPAFRNTKLRAGKWLREEEAYAELLIDLFEKGHLNVVSQNYDCPNGTTLRCYLSQKLHCAPMRISKKYAGRGIGKMVYLCKHQPPRGSTTSADGQQQQQQQKQQQLEMVLQTTEAKFIKAALPATNDFLALRSVSSIASRAACRVYIVFVCVS
jgi:hypothetical protein